MPIQVSQESLLQAAQTRLGLTFTIQGSIAQVPLSELVRVVLGVSLEAPTPAPRSELETKIQSSLASLRKNQLFSQHAPRELEVQVCLALGLSEKELSERLRVKISTVRSYKRRFLLGRPAIGVIQEILGGIAPSKGEVNWGGYLGRKREQILEVLRRAPRGLSTTDIAKEIKEVGGLLETDRSSEESPFAEIQDAEEAPLRSRSRLFAADEIKLPDLVVGVLGLNEQSKVLREGQPSDLALADQAVHGVRVTRATEPRSGGAPEAVKLD